MVEEITNERIDRFLADLLQADDSLACQAHASWFIQTYRPQIDTFIQEKRSLAGASYASARWAKKIERLLDRYSESPRGYTFDPRTADLGSLYATPPARSFRLARKPTHSLTFPTHHPLVRILGYAMMCLCTAAILTLGYLASRAIESFGHQWVARIESLLSQ